MSHNCARAKDNDGERAEFKSASQQMSTANIPYGVRAFSLLHGMPIAMAFEERDKRVHKNVELAFLCWSKAMQNERCAASA